MPDTSGALRGWNGKPEAPTCHACRSCATMRSGFVIFKLFRLAGGRGRFATVKSWSVACIVAVAVGAAAPVVVRAQGDVAGRSCGETLASPGRGVPMASLSSWWAPLSPVSSDTTVGEKPDEY